MKYIEAEKLKTEITRLKGQLIRGACASQTEMETNCKDEAYNEVLAIITSLQQEQLEVDLEKELENFARQYPMEDSGSYRNLMTLARHFYKLGLNARKEE